MTERLSPSESTQQNFQNILRAYGFTDQQIEVIVAAKNEAYYDNKSLQHLRDGDSVYVIPWSIKKDQLGNYYIDGSHIGSSKPSGSLKLRISKIDGVLTFDPYLAERELENFRPKVSEPCETDTYIYPVGKPLAETPIEKVVHKKSLWRRFLTGGN